MSLDRPFVIKGITGSTTTLHDNWHLNTHLYAVEMQWDALEWHRPSTKEEFYHQLNGSVTDLPHGSNDAWTSSTTYKGQHWTVATHITDTTQSPSVVLWLWQWLSPHSENGVICQLYFRVFQCFPYPTTDLFALQQGYSPSHNSITWCLGIGFHTTFNKCFCLCL